MPRIKKFELDQSVLAKQIYTGHPHMTTSVGLVIDQRTKSELNRVLQGFLHFAGCDRHVFLRIDVVVDASEALHVIEINVETQEGWGIALNLLRSSGNSLDECSALPAEIINYGDLPEKNPYLPEFELARDEFSRVGRTLAVPSWRERPGIPLKSELDDKIHLARFSRVWKQRGESGRVVLPGGYCRDDCGWQDVPDCAILKFRMKHGPAARRAGFSVIERMDPRLGKGKYVRRSFESGEMVAQDQVAPLMLNMAHRVQAIILCSGSNPVTGYTQIASSDSFVVNDKNSCKGPLVFE